MVRVDFETLNKIFRLPSINPKFRSSTELESTQNLSTISRLSLTRNLDGFIIIKQGFCPHQVGIGSFDLFEGFTVLGPSYVPLPGVWNSGV